MFTSAGVGRHWGDRDDFKQKTLETLRKWYKSDEALNPIEFHVSNWSKDEYIRGGPVGIFSPGTLSQMKRKIYEPEGNIHWAGTEYARDSAGYLDGAI